MSWELKLETPDAETLNAALGVITEINNISSSSEDDQDDQNLNSGTRAWRLVNTADDVEQVLSPFHSVEKNEVAAVGVRGGIRPVGGRLLGVVKRRQTTRRTRNKRTKTTTIMDTI
ncbi:hypothetical protein C8J57DRAFT_1242922 [Mycena rebaudengoi]|nr:hypothetical protein C8J57DRAFT_1242922 [Mycena rebaudengoi]